ncbi:MAG: LacI family DNA-binding transcriptional regulator [Capnocytophaga sp.]|nr:LacI family DNA-binding transcriptional regulator [Capnocytophaga sp.]
MTAITLKYLAEKLNLSTATVSKALRNYRDVHPETLKRVQELAKELNFRPSSLAANLRLRESKTIGLIIPEVVHHFFSSVVNGIVEAAEKERYSVIIMQSGESYETEKKQIEILLSKQVDGILITLSNETTDFSHLYQALDADVALVLFDKVNEDINCSKVTIDDVEAAYKATEHLIKSGCKNIIHIRGPQHPLNANERCAGYRKALEDNGLPFREDYIYTCKRVSYEEGYEFAGRILTEHPEADGLFAVTDLVAVGALSRFRDENVAVPERISVMGFSNWFMSSAVTPTLSTIDQPGYDIGKRAFEQLYKEMQLIRKHQPYTYESILLPTRVIARKSTKAI